MKIERINDNQIRCTLTSFDLSVRDLNLGELAYGSEKAKRLFREMIQKASSEVGFDAEDIPLSNESIMLIITKIEDPEELDTRFSKFAPMSDDEEPFAGLTSELLEGADSLLEMLAHNAASALPDHALAGQQGAQGGQDLTDGKGDGLNTLYKNTAKDRYYLVIRRPDTDSDSFQRVCNLLSEYGDAVKASSTAEAYFQEHYEVIVKEHALQTLSAL